MYPGLEVVYLKAHWKLDIAMHFVRKPNDLINLYADKLNKRTNFYHYCRARPPVFLASGRYLPRVGGLGALLGALFAILPEFVSV